MVIYIGIERCMAIYMTQSAAERSDGQEGKKTSRVYIYIYMGRTRVRVRAMRRPQKGPPSPKAGAGQENIGTVHEPKPIQTAGSPCMDRVAVLWEAPAAHSTQT